MESVVVFSGKDIPTIREEGGSGHWPARRERVERCEYLISVRNRREHRAATDLEHGTAFLIAKIDKVVPSPQPNRVVIKFHKYAELRIEDAWRTLTNGQRFPVAYDWTSEILKKLRIDLNKLDWKSLHGAPHQRPLFPPAAQKLYDHLAQPVSPYAVQEESTYYAAQLEARAESAVKENTFAKAIAGAKANLAESLGISVEAIEITIRT